MSPEMCPKSFGSFEKPTPAEIVMRMRTKTQAHNYLKLSNNYVRNGRGVTCVHLGFKPFFKLSEFFHFENLMRRTSAISTIFEFHIYSLMKLVRLPRRGACLMSELFISFNLVRSSKRGRKMKSNCYHLANIAGR